MLHSHINTILHGDSLELMKDIPDNSVDLILSDPPFGQNIGYGRGELGHRYIENDDNLDWLPTFVEEAYRILEDKGHCVLFWQWRTYSQLETEMIDKGFTIKTVGIWDKLKGGLGDGLVEQYEQIIFFRKGKARQNFYRPNIFKENRSGGGSRPDHPHQKPVKILKEIIELCSNKGDVVIDPFSGSGSTAMACINSDRQFLGMEIDKNYHQLSLNNVNKALGKVGLFA